MKIAKRTAVLIAGGALVGVIGAHSAHAGPLGDRGFAGGRVLLEVNGAKVGWLMSAEGGGATSDVVLEKAGPDGVVRKHIAAPKYDDIVVVSGVGMSSTYYDWIKATLDRGYPRKTGALVTADAQGNEHSRLQYFNAMISEVGFPAVDASSKDPGRLTVKLTPEYTRQVAPSKTKVDSPVHSSQAQKQWLSSHFKFSLSGLEQATAHTLRVEPFTVKASVQSNPVGELRDYQKQGAKTEYPNITFTVSERDAQPLFDWHKSFVIEGNNGQDKEKTATLAYLAPDLKAELFTVSMGGVGILKIGVEKAEGGDAARRVKVELYCETMSFKPGASAVVALHDASDPFLRPAAPTRAVFASLAK